MGSLLQLSNQKSDGTVSFWSYFKKINQLIRRKPFPRPKIKFMLLDMKATSRHHNQIIILDTLKYSHCLDQNIYILLSFPRVNTCTKTSNGRVEHSVDIPREISELFEGFDRLIAFVGDVLIIIKDNLTDNLKAMWEVPQKPVEEELKIKIEKSSFK